MSKWKDFRCHLNILFSNTALMMLCYKDLPTQWTRTDSESQAEILLRKKTGAEAEQSILFPSLLNLLIGTYVYTYYLHTHATL